MTILNENFDKELQRMAKLAGVQNNNLNENMSKNLTESSKEAGLNIEQNVVKILKEDDGVDLFPDYSPEDFETKKEVAKFSSPEKPSGELNKDIKAAMVLNNVSQYEATLYDLFTKYDPKTAGAKPEREGGTKDTIFTKYKIEKLPGGSKEINRLLYKKYGIDQKVLDDLRATGMPEDEIERTVADEIAKTKRVPLSYDGRVKESLAKWQLHHKNAYNISYANGTLTNTGKQQLEFLSRMLSERPLPTNGDANVDIEQALFDTAYKSVILENSEFIIRDFYNKALTPILAHRLKRNTLSPKDAQFDILKTAGIDHAIDMTKKKKYNASGEYKNFGAWFMTVAINKAIDGLISITDHKVDMENVTDMLYAHDVRVSGPFKVKSKLSPDKATGSYDEKVSDGSYKNKEGETIPYYIYSYSQPLDVMNDLRAGGKAIDGKYSPLAPDYLLEKGKFYVSLPKYTPETPDYVNPTFDENIAVIPGQEFLQLAADKVNAVLSKIASTMVEESYNSAGKVPTGETVKMSRPTSKPMSIDFYTGELLDKAISTYDYRNNFTSKKEYEVLDKKTAKPKTGGPDANYYKLLDDNGKEFWVRADSFASTKKMNDNVIAKLRNTTQSTIEILRMMLQYGDVMEKYDKAVYFYNPQDSTWTTVNKGGKVKVNPRTGEAILPFKRKDDLKSQYKSREEIPTKWVWDSLDKSGEKGTPEVNKEIVDELSRMAKERDFDLRADLFDANKNPLYKRNAEKIKPTINYLNAIRKKLKDYFSEGVKESKVDLNDLLKYYRKSEEAAAQGIYENHIRKVVREMLAAKLIK